MVADRLSRSCFNVLYPFCVSSIHPKTAGGAQNHYGFLEEIDGHPNGGSYSRRGWGKTYPQQTGAASGLKSRSTWMGLPHFVGCCRPAVKSRTFGQRAICSTQIGSSHKHITTTRIYDKRRRSVKDSASHKMPI
jgi:hypothetical protein